MWTDRFSLDFEGPEDTQGRTPIGLLPELSDAYMGVIQHPNGPPIACYSHTVATHIMSQKWRISKKVASNLIDFLSKNASGSAAPAFLKT